MVFPHVLSHNKYTLCNLIQFVFLSRGGDSQFEEFGLTIRFKIEINHGVV